MSDDQRDFELEQWTTRAKTALIDADAKAARHENAGWGPVSAQLCNLIEQAIEIIEALP